MVATSIAKLNSTLTNTSPQGGLINLNVLIPVLQTATPTTGQTVAMTDDANDGMLWITPAAGIAALTITFPSDANSRISQIRRIGTTKAIAVLSVSGATILNSVTTLVANDCFSYMKVAANTWVRLQ